jgi:hypothetical protein
MALKLRRAMAKLGSQFTLLSAQLGVAAAILDLDYRKLLTYNIARLSALGEAKK